MSTCTACGFDPAQWNQLDTAKTLGLAPEFVHQWGGGAIDPITSPLNRHAADDLLDGTLDDQLADVHRLWHALVTEVAPTRSPIEQAGTVLQLNTSIGGVPKTPIDMATIGVRGVEGDVQRARVHHGRPWQALCLWSADVIETLRAEGHPIEAGFAGENVTIGGVDWAELHGGARFTIGLGDDAVEGQLSLPAVPCSKNKGWFTDGAIGRIDHDLHPGFSRWYASVLTPGTARPGDAVRFV